MGQRVAEGRELAIESKKANLAVLRANQHADGLAEDLMTAESNLAAALGFGTRRSGASRRRRTVSAGGAGFRRGIHREGARRE